ncbi:MAG: ATP-binding cassette domain-containing protein [Acidimicrobiia bacterium]|nr:ATP-binding cassette domain-containing protein [Acidimicrobiia bacterium]
MSLVLRNIHKHYGSVRANDGVDLEIAPGELHGLLGENGAGKSTLMKVVSGFIAADSGSIEFDGAPLGVASPRVALEHGIGMLHQDPLVFRPFSVLDNFLLGSAGGVLVDRKGGRSSLAEMAARYGFDFDPDADARSLTVGERQQLEITRLLWRGARVLILDEPTTGISEPQRVKLFAVLRQLAAERLIVIFVSHKLEEVEALCHRVTVMSRGRVVGRRELPTPRHDLVRLMFGDITLGGARPEVTLGDPALSLRGVAARTRGAPLHADLTVRRGEVLGLAGLEGSGQRTFLRLCAGLDPVGSGTIVIGGHDLAGKPYRRFLDAGVHYIPAGRLEEGLIAGLSVAEHFELVGPNRSFMVDRGAADTLAAERIAEFSIKGEAATTAEALSGGNQQRLLMAMAPDHPVLLLMEHPTRGLDLGSAQWVWDRMLRSRAGGTAIVFASSDLEELQRYSDRIAVFYEGRIIAVIPASTATSSSLGLLIGGVVS